MVQEQTIIGQKFDVHDGVGRELAVVGFLNEFHYGEWSKENFMRRDVCDFKIHKPQFLTKPHGNSFEQLSGKLLLSEMMAQI